MNKTTFKKLSLIAACSLILSACGGGSEANSQPSYDNINLSPENLTADINESNYRKLIKQASSIYQVLAATYNIQSSTRQGFYVPAIIYEQDPSKDLSTFSDEDNPFRCIDGTSKSQFANFSNTGEAQNNSKITLNMHDCSKYASFNDGSVTITATDLQAETFTADYALHFSDDRAALKLDGTETSKWQGALQKTKYGFNSVYSKGRENVVFTVKGSADFTARVVNGQALGISLLLKSDNVQDIKGIGSFQFYTTTKLGFIDGHLNSGTIFAKGKTGEVELQITDGEFAVKLNGKTM